MHPEAERLFALDEALHREADEMLAASGIGAILQDCGFVPVGSYAMRTMTWRDLDFERGMEPDWAEFWGVCTRFAATGWCTRLQCVDVYREGWWDYRLYCGLRVAPPHCAEATPGDDLSTWKSDVWKLDVWTARAEEFERQAGAHRRTWQGLLTDETRSHVLALKEAVCQSSEYRKTLLSVHIYEAVLEHGIRDEAAFRRWWQSHHAPAQ